MSPSPRRPYALVLLLAVVLGLSGCMKLEGELEVHADDTVSGTVIVGVSTVWAEGNGQDPLALQNIMIEELATTPDSGVTGEPYDDDDFVGMVLTLDEVEISRIEEATSGALIIDSDENGYAIGGRFTDLDTTAPDPAGEGEVPTPWTVDLAVTFPAEVTDHDGERDGRTVSWELQPGDDELFATTGAPGFTLPIPLPVMLFGLILIAGGAVIWIGRRRRRKA